MTAADQRLYFNLCNPDEPLRPENERNVDVDEMGDPDRPIRGLKWSSKLAQRIEYAIADEAIERPACEYFTGLPGSGKSTEIWRLARRLQRKDGANLFTVRVDAEDLIDTRAEVDISDVRIALLYEVERQVLSAEGRSDDEAGKDGVMAAIVGMLSKLSFSGVKADVGLPIGPKLAVEMRAQAGLRHEIRKRVAAHTSTFLSETDHQLRLLKDRARKCGYAGIAVLMDSLEKLRGTSATFEAVLNSAERLFAEDAPYLRLPVHVLYTIPPALILRLKMPVHFMPMMKLWERDGTPFPDGQAAAVTIIRKRIPKDDVLRDVFGVRDGGQLEQRLQLLINWSAGYPREIIRLLQNAVADAPLTERGFRRLLGRSGDDYRRLLLTSDFDLLARVSLQHDLTPASEQERRVADRLLSNQVVLRYQNDSEWYEVHPAVRDMPGLQEALQRMQGGRPG